MIHWVILIDNSTYIKQEKYIFNSKLITMVSAKNPTYFSQKETKRKKKFNISLYADVTFSEKLEKCLISIPHQTLKTSFQLHFFRGEGGGGFRPKTTKQQFVKLYSTQFSALMLL